MRDGSAGFLSVAAVLLSVGSAAAQPPAARPQMRGDGPAPSAAPFSITGIDPAFDAIVAPGTQPELLASGFGINEGVLWINDGKDGYVLVSSLIDNVIYRITADHHVSVFMEKAGYSGNDVNHVGIQTRAGRSHVIIIGPNCAGLDAQGRLVWCAGQDRAVKRLEKDGIQTVLADRYEGKRFNGPNDIAIKSDGAIYITDSDVGLRDGAGSPLKEMPNNVWLWKDGKVTLALAQDRLGAGPNGVALSPDEKYLYLTAGRTLKRYDIETDGTLGDAYRA